jgi:2,3,4,5-tetrahydropyridine-2-carboxylate N-succinyltransferase
MKIPHRPPEQLKTIIEATYQRLTKSSSPMTADEINCVDETMGLIDRGRLRICEPTAKGWVVNSWMKLAILLYFRKQAISEITVGQFQWTDKIPVKVWDLEMGVRVVPPAVVRFGAFVAKGAILMPSYVNIGAYVDEGTMVDTWATVGSCAQIGKNVHLSGGVGIGGVLEPAQAQPVIIEDNCFVGSRAVIVEGVHVKKGAVIGAGVVLTKSTPIFDVRQSNAQPSKGVIPENAVVIPGTRNKSYPAGEFATPCALIIGERTASTDLKTSLNQALRDHEVPV